MRMISMIFNSPRDFFSPSKMAMVSLPTIRSPCMSRMSKKVVLTNTMPAAHKNISAVTQPAVPVNESAGRTAVTTPQAMAIKRVFEPGISRIRRYLTKESGRGTSRMLYDSPIRLMASSSRKGKIPRVYAITSPTLPEARARKISSLLYRR